MPQILVIATYYLLSSTYHVAIVAWFRSKSKHFYQFVCWKALPEAARGRLNAGQIERLDCLGPHPPDTIDVFAFFR